MACTKKIRTAIWNGLKKRSWNNKSILISWLISYLSILLIPITISGFFYMESARIVEKEINNNNFVMLKQIQRIIDKKMSDVQRLSLQIAWDPKIKSLVYSRAPMDSHGRYVISEVKKDVFLYRVANSYIDEIYIYLHDTDMFINSRTSYSMDLLKGVLADHEKISAGQFKKLSGREYMNQFTNMEIWQGKTRKSTIACIQSLPYGVHHTAQATMLILLDYDAFLDEISSLEGLQQGNVVILDEKSQVVASTDSAHSYSGIQYGKFQDNSLSHQTIDGKEYVLSSIHSQVNDWKYLFILPSGVFLEKVKYIKRLTGYSILLCLIIGGIVSYLFTRRNYNPVQEIVHALADTAGIELNPGWNEYRFIRKAITNTLDAKEKMEQKLERQKITLRSDFLVRLIKGIPERSVPIDEALSSYGIEWPGDSFCVMLFYIEDFRQLFAGESSDSVEQLKLVRFIIANVTEELINRKYRGFVLEVDDLTACLVNIREDRQAGAKNDLNTIAGEIQHFIRENFFIHMTISIGNIHFKMAGIPQSFQEAKEAMQYRMIMGSERIIGYYEIVNPKNNYDYPIEKEQQLINAIKTGDFQAAQNIINNVFQQHFSGEMISVEMTKCLLFDLMSTMIKALNDIDMPDTSAFVEELNPITRLSGSNTVMEMKYEIMNILKKICDYIVCNKKDRNQKIADQIRFLVDQNYTDANLCIAGIAEEFGLTGPYISKIFKDQTGEGIQDYINKVRIRRAKVLLIEERWNLDRTAKKVGYCNSNGLIRIFKKYEGLTPGKYREMNR